MAAATSAVLVASLLPGFVAAAQAAAVGPADRCVIDAPEPGAVVNVASVPGVQPGKKVSVSMNSTRTSIPAGKATVTAAATIDGKKVTASVDASYGASN